MVTGREHTVVRGWPLVLLCCALSAASILRAADAPDDLDANRDGRVSRAEYKVARDARFDRFDRNRDNVLNAEDVALTGRSEAEHRQIGQLLRSADTDRDGHVSRAELLAADTPLFDRADADRDGYLDRAEAASLAAALAARR